MTDAMAVAAAAMRTAENRVSAAAGQILHATTPPAAPVAPAGDSRPSGYNGVHVAVPTTDLVEGMIDLKQSELAFREGVTVFKAADETTRRTLDILT
jgi:hypothetical protein